MKFFREDEQIFQNKNSSIQDLVHESIVEHLSDKNTNLKEKAGLLSLTLCRIGGRG